MFSQVCVRPWGLGVTPANSRGLPQTEGVPGQGGKAPVQRWGTPSQGWGQQMEYLIRRERYASCIHAGGLSCFLYFWNSRECIIIQLFIL